MALTSRGIDIHTRRARLRFAHLDPRARNETREECGCDLNTASAGPRFRRRLANAKYLRGNQGRICTRSDAGSHVVRPSKHGLDAQRMGM